jgi:3-hydroxyisobutyrate dehydrogenase-like beta-hydroxyacid dehydrogenase
MGNPKVVRAGKMTAAVSGPRDAFVLAEPYLNMLGPGKNGRKQQPSYFISF